MSPEPSITCPHCHTEIRLTESLAAHLIAGAQAQFDQQLAAKDHEIAERAAGIQEKERQIAETRRTLDTHIAEQVARHLETERAQLVAEESRKARQAAANELLSKTNELKELQSVLASRDEKLAEAQQSQAEMVKKQRELDDARRELELTVEKRVTESLVDVRNKARMEAEEGLRLKVAEKDHTIASMQQKIEELKLRSEQGSQQLQGEVQELELESVLQTRFPIDMVKPVPKGEFGGDVLHHVISTGGVRAGTMLWESKRTKNWSDGWLTKLRDDQRAAKAEIAIIVSQALPGDLKTFDLIDGVWVVHPTVTLPVAIVLRQSLLELSLTRAASEGQETKAQMVYQYLSGPRFRQRIEAIVEAFSAMRIDLESERKAIMRQWAKREAQIERVMNTTVGMYGDLQGIAGQSIQEIEGLSFPALGQDG